MWARDLPRPFAKTPKQQRPPSHFHQVIMNKYMYVDLITLLPPPATTTGDETKDKKPATVESFDQWLEAWSTHEKTYLTNPARYLELAQYSCIIQKANWKFCWKAVYDFDVQFRMSLSGTTKRLDQIDSTPYTTTLDSSAVRAEGTSCQHCKSDHHLVWDCSFRTKQTLESKVWSKASTSAMSQWKFAKWFHNSLEGCNLYKPKACQQGKDCKRAHVCKACRRDHAMADCKLTSSS